MSDRGATLTGFDLVALREKIGATSGKEYWRGLDELADSEDFQRYLHAEFPGPAAFLDTPVSRRGFLRVMGASLALAGLNACTRQPTEKIYPYVKQPEEIVPGEPLFYATAFVLDGYATGVLVESHLGRPTKIEGNPEHPTSCGATDVLAQASVLELYDPDRAQVISRVGEIRPWSAFVEAMGAELERYDGDGGKGLRLLTETVTSPTLASQIRALLAKYPRARWHQYQPVNDDNARRAAVTAFGENVDTHYTLVDADVILSLDADFLAQGPAHVRLAREFADRRRVDGTALANATMNRLYVVEPTMTITGAKADHRLRTSSRNVETFARRLAVRLGLPGGAAPEGAQDAWLDALARDLKKHRGRSAVIAGRFQSPAVHVLAHAINHALGNVGRTVKYSEPIAAEPTVHADSLAALVADMKKDAVSMLVVIGGNPAYTTPTDSGFRDALADVPTSVHLSLEVDETSQLCTWHVSAAHTLESWSDARSETGLATIVQPLIDPLYSGKTPHDLLSVLLGSASETSYDVVREHWKEKSGGDFESFWRRAVHDGLVAGTEAAARLVTLREGWHREIAAAATGHDAEGAVEVVIRPDAHLHDGRFANNAWLHELPKPVSRLTWDNALHVSPVLAAKRGLSNGDVVELQAESGLVRVPVWIVPGMADDTAEVTLGYGRSNVGRVGSRVGVDVAPLRSSSSPWRAMATLVRTGVTHELVTTQSHGSMEGRNLVREATLERFRHQPDFVREHEHIKVEGSSMFPPHPYEGYAWGMVIDLAACIGCNACTIACQSENNIPVVGKDQVANGREMHWIRVDRYFNGTLEDPAVVHQPVPCMHCENAPCELVCPVNATVHDHEGLNAMVYNRCVGTRYCANNCPYKVRRFNFFLYTDWTTETQKMLNNPDVTVRSRGVMEKCTYCTQRINHARIAAKRDSRKIRDGDFETACQQVCPTEAISFGDLNDPGSRVSKAHADPRNYALLGELGTKPRTTYLAELRNPNPELAGAADGHHGGSHTKGHG
jgi:MoCo/4Fe-4S cofactor protein with predicted Tat translocation signal